MRSSKSKVRTGLRLIWLRSNERNAAIRYYKNTCQRCSKKASRAKGREVKIEVHHKEGIGNWDKIIENIMAELLVSPEKLECLCKECHKKETYVKTR